MAGIELEELETYHEKILKKYEFSGISSLTPSEICVTLLSPSWEYYFYQSTKIHWLNVIGNYRSTLLSFLKSSSDDEVIRKEQENNVLRKAAGLKFLELLDDISINSTGKTSDPSLKDDHIIDRLKESLSKKNLSLMNLLSKNDANNDGLMSKSEFITALEEIEVSPYDIIALTRMAGYQPTVSLIPIAGFSDFLTKRPDDRKKAEYELFTKVLSAFHSIDKNLGNIFSFLDTNKDGVISFEELRTGLNKKNVNLTIAECKQLFTVIDKDRSGSISLDELKKKLNSLKSGGHDAKNDGSKINGTLEVIVLKGQKFRPGAKTVKVKFGANEFTSSSVADANPEWKFKNTFEVNSQNVQNVPRDIEFEVFSGKKSEGKAFVSLSDIRNTDVYKGKADIMAGKQVHGTLLIKSTWTDVEVQPSSNTGKLSITIIRGQGINSDYVFTAANMSVVASGKELGRTYLISNIKKSPDLTLSIKSLTEGEATLPLSDMILESTRVPYEVVLGKTKLFVQILWEEPEPEEIEEDQAATKIQAVWRGYYARNSVRLKCPRKMILRKAMTFDKRKYLLVAYQLHKEIEIEVHPGDSNQIGTFPVLSSNIFPDQDANELLGKLTLKPNFRLGSIMDKETLRGDLTLELVSTKNIPPSIFAFTIADQSTMLTSGKKDQAEFNNLSFKSIPSEISCSVLDISNKNHIGETKVYWAHAVGNPGEWNNSISYVGNNGAFIVKVKWTGLPDVSKEEHAAIVIQKNWKALREREEMKIKMRSSCLVARRGVNIGNRIYLISVVQDEGEWCVQLHPADNPQIPTFETIHKVKVSKYENPEDLFKALKIEDEKLKIN